MASGQKGQSENLILFVRVEGEGNAGKSQMAEGFFFNNKYALKGHRAISAGTRDPSSQIDPLWRLIDKAEFLPPVYKIDARTI